MLSAEARATRQGTEPATFENLRTGLHSIPRPKPVISFGVLVVRLRQQSFACHTRKLGGICESYLEREYGICASVRS